ncbi:WD repeat-containing protein 21 [Neolecta irregularis DAH-3]|uniref:WD repeat-containing protein 21 n=1 Tax=Neolecta irregularis (strain DAH-3) TaxID=1198029 RepID=A0A1U7LQE1_NEOID|nr:WD repeat-containing protein 21 [Neolecta irregularis DAH-3]|eukprot:OLL24849.1 WD repeat-containing protein 21 [Neolecta irregularis DAH-3]
MDNPGIPGFFYDPQKKKYFKIMPNHKCGSSHPYSQQTIAKREKLETAEKADKINLRQRGFQKSYIETRSLCNQSQSAQQDFRSRLSVQKSRLSFGYIDPYVNVTAIAYDFNTGNLIFGDHTGLVSLLQPTCEKPQPMFNFFSETTCIAIGSDRRLVATCQGNERGAGMIHISALTNQEGVLDLQNHITLTPHRNQSIWTCAISSSNKIAVGGSGMFMLIEQSGHDCTQRILRSKSDVFAVQFLDENVCMAGSRDGCIRAFDSRVKSDDHQLFIRHSSTVAGIKVLSEYQIIVNGLRNSLKLYDVRFPHPPAPSSLYSAPSKPVFEYTGHINEHSLTLGFDANRNTGIITAAGSDNRLRFWNSRFSEPFSGAESLDSHDLSIRAVCLAHDAFWIASPSEPYTMEQYKIP